MTSITGRSVSVIYRNYNHNPEFSFRRAGSGARALRQQMKRKKKVILCAAFVIASSLLALAFLLFSMPLVWYDQQGRDLVTILESKFDLPIEERESREAIFHGGFSYLTLKGWKTGSRIFVYGVQSKSLQDQLIEHATLVVNDQKMNDVVLEFHPARVFVTKGAWSELVETEPIRDSRIRAIDYSRL